MSYTLHITLAAERDISHAADYIEFSLKNPQTAERLLDKAEEQLCSLTQFPQKHPLVEDKILASWGIRFTQVPNYLAFYVITEETQQITIIRFLYTRSDWASVLKYGFSLTS